MLPATTLPANCFLESGAIMAASARVSQIEEREIHQLSLGAKPHVARADIEDIRGPLRAPKKVIVFRGRVE